ncbi:MAG: hypothetical protein M3P30_00195 [Chloroflexota bacterium]|nr:hypothetical protein [Chloroflexota bacterium]
MGRKEQTALRRRSRAWRWRVLLAVTGVVLTCSIAGIVAVFAFVTGGASGRPRAVIVDQLAITDPNQAFVDDATQKLRDAGYDVDYRGPDTVSVDYYRSLPGRGYKLIVLRSHAAEQVERDKATGEVHTLGDAALFTNELYTTGAHLQDQYASVLGIGTIPQMPELGRLFTVPPVFVASQTHGRFDGTLVVLMGCAGLKTEGLARAFVSRGASEFISWDDSVTATHTDEATTDLLQHLLGEQLPVKEAVARTMADVGPDPELGARLTSYP